MADNSSRPSRARDVYLNGLPAEKQVEVLQRTEKAGPGPNDPDWIIVLESVNAAARIEAAAARVETTAKRVEERADRGPSVEEVQAAIAEAVGDAVQRVRAEAVSEPSRVVASARAWYKSPLVVFVGGLAAAVAIAWAMVYLGPRVGLLGVSASAAGAMILAGVVALWREVPAPPSVRGVPVQQLASFAGGLLAAVGIAWLAARGHVVPLEMRFGVAVAAGVAIGLLWRGRR